MATIANQISRIQSARNLLRTKGVAMNLVVPAGTYWDDATDANVTTTSAAALASTDQIDKIAAAFNSIVVSQNKEIKVPMKVVTDGTTTTAEGVTLDTGFYAGATIIPYITVQTVDDVVLNIQAIAGRKLTTQTGTITPSSGYNYISSLGYTIQDGAISGTAVSYDNSGVTVKVSTSGWLDAEDTKKVTVTTSSMTSKVGSNSATTISSGATVTPHATSDTTLTITSGIYGSNRTLTVKSVKSQTTPASGESGATAADILASKVAWVNGAKVTGTMPNYGGVSDGVVATAAAGLITSGTKLAIKPALGYYNNYSSITTTIDIRTKDSLTFNTTSISSPVLTNTMTAQTYYETIPAGYYASQVTRKVSVRSAAVTTSVDYTNHKAVLTVGTSGWISGTKEIPISAGPAVYKQATADLQSTTHKFTVTPAKDQDGTQTSYLTQVTIDNTEIFNLLSSI